LRTLGSPLVVLLLQATAGATSEGSSTGIVSLIARSTALTFAVLGLLGLLSVWSWGIFLYKWWTFRRAARQSAQFLEVFRQNASPDAPNGPNPRAPAGRPTLKSLTAVDRALLRASAVEVNKLESRVSFLATVASMAPFVGLFGTVWGIMSAFEQIGITGSTSLQAVGTPIAEALVATAAGLAAAIPAVIFYNYLSQRVRLFASEMDDFAMEFLNISERNFT